MKITENELKDRWAARSGAALEGPPSGYRFCHVGGHFVKLTETCSCKVKGED